LIIVPTKTPNPDPELALQAHRRRLDEIDQSLLGLITERLALAHQIAIAKSCLSPSDQLPRLFSPEREAQLITALRAKTQEPDLKAIIPKLWQVLMASSLRLQASHFSDLKIMAAKSTPNSLIEQVLWQRFDPLTQIEWVMDDKSLIKAMEMQTKSSVLGILPIQASLANYAYLLATDKVHIVAGDAKAIGSGSGFVILAKHPPEISGDDLTLFVTDAQLKPQMWDEALSRAGLAGSFLMGAQGFSLLGLCGYVQKDDPRLEAIAGKLKGCIGALALIESQ
jgi:chorismate mutase